MIWPQVTMVVLLSSNVLCSTALAGINRDPWKAVTAYVGVTVSMVLLYYGSFFAPLGWAP